MPGTKSLCNKNPGKLIASLCDYRNIETVVLLQLQQPESDPRMQAAPIDVINSQLGALVSSSSLSGRRDFGTYWPWEWAALLKWSALSVPFSFSSSSLHILCSRRITCNYLNNSKQWVYTSATLVLRTYFTAVFLYIGLYIYYIYLIIKGLVSLLQWYTYMYTITSSSAMAERPREAWDVFN